MSAELFAPKAYCYCLHPRYVNPCQPNTYAKIVNADADE